MHGFYRDPGTIGSMTASPPARRGPYAKTAERRSEIIASATPKRDYYCQSARGNRLFELGLGEVALAFTATSSKADQLAIDAITGVHGCADFAARWLRHRGLAWAAELLPAPSPLLKPGPRSDQSQE